MTGNQSRGSQRPKPSRDLTQSLDSELPHYRKWLKTRNWSFVLLPGKANIKEKWKIGISEKQNSFLELSESECHCTHMEWQTGSPIKQYRGSDVTFAEELFHSRLRVLTKIASSHHANIMSSIQVRKENRGLQRASNLPKTQSFAWIQSKLMFSACLTVSQHCM